MTTDQNILDLVGLLCMTSIILFTIYIRDKGD